MKDNLTAVGKILCQSKFGGTEGGLTEIGLIFLNRAWKIGVKIKKCV
jgi:hypothetical protein